VPAPRRPVDRPRHGLVERALDSPQPVNLAKLTSRGVLLLGAAVFAALVVTQALTALVIAFVGNAQDFGSYWIAASRTAAGGTPYDWLAVDRPIAGDETEHVYPPLLAVLLMPLTGWLDYPAARLLWLLFSVLCLGVGLALSWRLSGLRASRHGGYAALAALALLPSVSITLAVGQLSCQLLLLLAGIFALRRARRWAAAGAVLGFSIYLKVFPAIVGGYLLLRREWRAAVGAAVTGAALVGFTVLAIGWEPHWTYLTRVLPAQSRLFGLPQNVSLTGFVTHTAIANAYTTPVVAADLAGRALVALASLALLAAAGYAVWRGRSREGADAPAYALTVVTALLITPATGFYNLVVAALPLGVAISRAAGGRPARAALLVAAIVLLGLPTDLCELLPVRVWCFDYWVAQGLPTAALPWRVGWGNLLMAGPFYGLLLLWGLLWRLCLSERASEAEQPEPVGTH